jgi:hypothetical protein
MSNFLKSVLTVAVALVWAIALQGVSGGRFVVILVSTILLLALARDDAAYGVRKKLSDGQR